MQWMCDAEHTGYHQLSLKHFLVVESRMHLHSLISVALEAFFGKKTLQLYVHIENSFFLMNSALSTFTALSAVTPLTMFRRLNSELKGFMPSRNLRSVSIFYVTCLSSICHVFVSFTHIVPNACQLLQWPVYLSTCWHVEQPNYTLLLSHPSSSLKRNLHTPHEHFLND